MLSGQLDTRFGSFRLDARLDLPAQGVHAVFGPSGCGKTLLLRCIAGLERRPGVALRWGKETWQGPGQWCPPHRRGLGYVAQQPGLFPHLSVRGNLEYGWRRRPGRLQPERIIDLLQLDALLAQPVASLSGGQRQRLAIGRALLAAPRMLLLDEPLSALDRPARLAILGDLRRLHGELDCPMLYVSHAAEEVERLADRVLLMRDGQLQAAQDLSELCARGDAPLDPEAGPACLYDARTQSWDAAESLAELAQGGLHFRLPCARRPPAIVRLRIAARDVALALQPPARSSFQNVLPLRLHALHAHRPGCLLADCRSGEEQTLLAEISLRSVRELQLAPGMAVFALVKAVALLD